MDKVCSADPVLEHAINLTSTLPSEIERLCMENNVGGKQIVVNIHSFE